MEKQKILIVEDNATNRLFIVNILDGLYTLLECENGQEAIELTNTFKPDLILMDVEMPVMNGFDACEVLQADSKHKDIPIIFLTSQESKAYEATALNIGAIDYITKPINSNVLQARIKIHLDLINARKERDTKIQELEKMLRIFELKLRPPVTKRVKKQTTPTENLEEYVSFEHTAELEDLESEMDAIINLMFLNKTLRSDLLVNLSVLMQSYSKILRFYPIFNTLGTALNELAIVLEKNKENNTQEYIDTVLTYFESLFFTLKHWGANIVNKEIKNPNMYDASMLSDIQMISLTFEKKLSSIQSDIEFF